jgi:hypothetical protein
VNEQLSFAEVYFGGIPGNQFSHQFFPVIDDVDLCKLPLHVVCFQEFVDHLLDGLFVRMSFCHCCSPYRFTMFIIVKFR